MIKKVKRTHNLFASVVPGENSNLCGFYPKFCEKRLDSKQISCSPFIRWWGSGVYMKKLPHNLFTLEVPELNSKFCAWNYPNIWGKVGAFWYTFVVPVFQGSDFCGTASIDDLITFALEFPRKTSKVCDCNHAIFEIGGGGFKYFLHRFTLQEVNFNFTKSITTLWWY